MAERGEVREVIGTHMHRLQKRGHRLDESARFQHATDFLNATLRVTDMLQHSLGHFGRRRRRYR